MNTIKDDRYYQQLFNQWFNNEASTREVEELMQWYQLSDRKEDLKSVLKEKWNTLQPETVYSSADLDALANRILLQRPVVAENIAVLTPGPVELLKRNWYWYAAVFLLVVGSGTYYWFQNNPSKSVASVPAHLSGDIAPGKEGAILTLADGSQVLLDSLGNGIIAKQNGVDVLLLNGQLSYDAANGASAEIMYNTMTTPKGRRFRLQLPDGTEVWLNAASSIRYPSQFAGTERRVEVTGEAYFEVAKNAEMPFRISVNNKAELEVLGTSFNVNAYEDELKITTTLLEGSVKVAATEAATGGTLLKPGQQAQLGTTGKLSQEVKVNNRVDIEKVIAWKNGLFNFEGDSLAEVMRQLERWYNIKVEYENAPSETVFGGKIQRSLTLAKIIENLEDKDLGFLIKENVLYVRSK